LEQRNTSRNIQYVTITKKKDKFRAFEYDISTFTYLNGKRLIIREMMNPKEFIDYENKGEVGSIIYDSNKKLIFIKSEKSWIPIQKLQFEGKKIVTAHEFYVGQQMNKFNLICNYL
jgi:methionyl-tRNA formyltransferase